MSQQLQNYLVDLVEEVHHYYVLKAETKEAAITKTYELFDDKGDDGITMSEDEVTMNQCINLNNPEETSQML